MEVVSLLLGPRPPALSAQGEVAAAARAERFPGPAATAWTTRARAVADLGWALLGARARGDDATVASLAHRLPDAAG
jgi:hypothetical protein